MGIKSWLDKKINDATYTEKINSMDSRNHSRAYHRYFAGYTEVKKPKGDGTGFTIERIYTGTYYRRRMDRTRSTLLKILYVLLVLAAAVMYVMSAVQRTELNSLWYVTALEAVSFALIVWTFIASGNYVIAPEKMTRYEYNSSSKSIQRSSMCAAAGFFLLAFSSAVYIFLHDEMSEIWFSARFLIGSVCLFAVNRLEYSVDYEKFASEMSGKVNGTEIQ